jgi:hypothetical protein
MEIAGLALEGELLHRRKSTHSSDEIHIVKIND